MFLLSLRVSLCCSHCSPPGSRPGSRPAFFASPKKVGKERRPDCRALRATPSLGLRRREKKETRPRFARCSDNFFSDSAGATPSSARHTGFSQSGPHKVARTRTFLWRSKERDSAAGTTSRRAAASRTKATRSQRRASLTPPPSPKQTPSHPRSSNQPTPALSAHPRTSPESRCTDSTCRHTTHPPTPDTAPR